MSTDAPTKAATAAWAQQCPLCHQPNQCAPAQGRPPEECWCMRAPVAPAALAKIPAAERGQRCICPVCARPAPDAAPSATPPGPRL
ncbi:MAG: cysteine-rich CWC family protein [Simplicispira sp.]|uniref:cysteine-rich CWC family protein n=1 Tax=Simplicispira sp. TaxID=2015802 RepID=UPI0025903C48|nr:cysteine-rich CWC family protein [Simplicispira sp.]MDD2691018.1 cysteine-rich CWC family protein [Simplicispira sp.]